MSSTSISPKRIFDKFDFLRDIGSRENDVGSPHSLTERQKSSQFTSNDSEISDSSERWRLYNQNPIDVNSNFNNEIKMLNLEKMKSSSEKIVKPVNRKSLELNKNKRDINFIGGTHQYNEKFKKEKPLSNNGHNDNSNGKFGYKLYKSKNSISHELEINKPIKKSIVHDSCLEKQSIKCEVEQPTNLNFYQKKSNDLDKISLFYNDVNTTSTHATSILNEDFLSNYKLETDAVKLQEDSVSGDLKFIDDLVKNVEIFSNITHTKNIGNLNPNSETTSESPEDNAVDTKTYDNTSFSEVKKSNRNSNDVYSTNGILAELHVSKPSYKNRKSHTVNHIKVSKPKKPMHLATIFTWLLARYSKNSKAVTLISVLILFTCIGFYLLRLCFSYVTYEYFDTIYDQYLA